MDLNDTLICPKCNNKSFVIKREVTYVYTYKLNDNNVTDVVEKTDNLPFLFDNREKCGSVEYIVCERCGEDYPIHIDKDRPRIDLTILRKAVRSDSTGNPEFLG
jgi:uncharacterized protein YbaR (Trm112 family)